MYDRTVHVQPLLVCNGPRHSHSDAFAPDLSILRHEKIRTCTRTRARTHTHTLIPVSFADLFL
jgi:hypothetical protein